MLPTDAPAFFTKVDILDEISGLDHKIIQGSMSILRPQHKQMPKGIFYEKKLLKIIADDCIPHNDIHVRARDKPGMTVAIRVLFRQCKRLHKKWKRTGDAVHHEQLRNKMREAKSAFRASRDKFYNNTAIKLTDPNTPAKKRFGKSLNWFMAMNMSNQYPT